MPEHWEQRSVTLLRSLPLDCRDRQLIVALLTLPLGEVDKAVEGSLEKPRNATVNIKKSRSSAGALSGCLHDHLKWPAKELDIAHAIHQGVFLLSCFASSRSLSCECAFRTCFLLLAGVFALQQLVDDDRSVSEISRSEIAFALRVIPSHMIEFAHLAPTVGRFRASVDDKSSVEKWEQLRQRIQEDDLSNICCEHCLLDGRAVQSLLGVQGSETAKSIHLILQARTALRFA